MPDLTIVVRETDVALLDELADRDWRLREQQASAMLETALSAFEGTVLCVSHDRYFLDRTVKRLWVLEPPTMRDFAGNYSRWHEKVVIGGIPPRSSKRAWPQERTAESGKRVTCTPRHARSFGEKTPLSAPFGVR